MSERVGVELAEEFVRKFEDRELDHMRKAANQAEIAVEVCGCRTCHHVARVTQAIFEDELCRIYGEDDDTLGSDELIHHFGG